MIENIIAQYKEILFFLAEIAASSLELVGIIIIIVGSFRALVRLFQCLVKKLPFHVVIDLGKALSLALEFKMGAEIVKTVIVRDLKELLILGIIIILRAILAVLIHWEITTEEKEEKAHAIAREAARKREEEEEKKKEKEKKTEDDND